jgi:superfamily I DNA and/or RNA helicase
MTADNEGKVLLTTQYRVPRDIANVLNSHIYKGRYDTAPTCQAPLNGFRFVDVPRSRSFERNEKYVNKDEIRYCIELARQSSMEYDSIMVLTPVRLSVDSHMLLCLHSPLNGALLVAWNND